jgi:tRNA threonylcarbamoyladenosine biosynthesis protein TsaE
VSEVVLALPSVERTRALGRRLGELLSGGDFVGLSGSLGAGKTELTRALCEGAGVPMEQVSSPTFAIVQSYRGGRLPLHHADLYRIGDGDELYATGFFDLQDADGAMVVEWIDQVPDAAPADHLRLELRITAPEARALKASANGPRSEALLLRWLGEEA